MSELQLSLSSEFDYNPNLKTDDLTDQWYTPIDIIERVKKVFGGYISLDPASCGAANRVVQAEEFYDEEDDGLKLDWFGDVFCNPPYSKGKIGPFCEKVVSEYKAGECRQAIFLLKEGATTAWFRPLRPYLTCYLDQRVKFVDGATGKICESPRSGHCLVYLGTNESKFVEVMSEGGFAYFPNLQL